MRRIAAVLVSAVLMTCSVLVVPATPASAATTSGYVTPAAGPLTPAQVAVVGRGLSSVSKVRFGTSVISHVAHRGPTRLVLTTPLRHTPGLVAVSLWNGHKWISAGHYRFQAKPVIVSLSRASGEPIGGGSLVITGRSLAPTPTVKFGTTKAVIHSMTSTKLAVVVPPGLDGAVSVTVTTPGGVSAGQTFTYATPAPAAASTYTPLAGTITADPTQVQWVGGGPDPDDPLDTAYSPWIVSLAPGAAVPSVGDGYYVAPGQDVFPSGLTGIVSSLASQVDGSTRVTVEPAAMDETMSSAQVSFSGDNPSPIAAARVQPNASGEVDQDFTGKASYSGLDSSAFTCTNGIGEDVSFNGSLSIEFTKLHPVAYFSATTGPSFDVYLTGTVVITGKITAEESIDCSLTPLWVDAHRRIIPIGTTGATISFGPAAELKLSVGGSVEVDQTTRFMYGVTKYMSDPTQWIHVAVNTDRSVSVNTELSLTASAGVSVQFGLLDRIGVQAKAELYVSGSASAPVAGATQFCFSADWGFSIGINAFLDLFIVRWDSGSTTFKINFNLYKSCSAPTTPAPPSSAPVITSTVLPSGTVGDGYDTTLSTADGRSGTWSLPNGGLPAGLNLDAAGEITGTPVNVGTARFAVQFTDDSAQQTTSVVELDVEPSVGLGGGDMQATLTWNGVADLDLHAEEPDSNEIYYGNSGPSAGGGELDHDSNAACSFVDPSPTENIHWPAGEAEAGAYFIWAQTYETCGTDDLNWHLVVRIRGQVVLDTTGYDSSIAYEVDYDPNNPAVTPTVHMVAVPKALAAARPAK